MFRRNKLTFLNTKDDRIKVINERIALTEKHLIGLCNVFAAGTRKMARSRDIYDELAKSFKGYADDEEMNESLTDGLKNFTNALTILGDYMDHNVHRMESKVVNELAQIESLCKTTRDNLRAAVITRDKEVLKQRQLIDIKSKFTANNSAADSDLLKAKLEVTRANKQIDEIINNFEKRKLASVKEVLHNFVMIALKYHTKSIEALTASYYDISNIDEKSDFREFQRTMKTKEEEQTKKLAGKKALLMKSQSMDHLEGEHLLNPLKKRNRLSRSQKSLTNKESDDEEEGEEDDDDEEDDDEEEEEFDENSEEDSGSASEDEDEDSEVHGKAAKSTKHGIELKKTKLNREAIKRQQPFKAIKVMKPPSRPKQLNKPFAANRFVDDNATTQFSKGSTTKPIPSSRLVTVVESKSSSKRFMGHDGGGDG